MGAVQKVLQISSHSKSGRRIIVLARRSSTEPHLYFTCRFSAYTWTCALVLFQSYLICMYAFFICLFSALTIENKLTFLGFILSSLSLWRKLGGEPRRSGRTHRLSILCSDPTAPLFLPLPFFSSSALPLPSI